MQARVLPPPRSPLPKRRGRNEDPVGKYAKAAKTAKAKADKKEKEADKQEKIAKVDAAKDTLAEMEADESFVQTQESQHRVRRQSDMETTSDNGDNDSGDESVGLTDGDSSGEDSKAESESSTDDSDKLSKKRNAKVHFGLYHI
jgi:hypothetical protein